MPSGVTYRGLARSPGVWRGEKSRAHWASCAA
jgi:hypothetical protein